MVFLYLYFNYSFFNTDILTFKNLIFILNHILNNFKFNYQLRMKINIAMIKYFLVLLLLIVVGSCVKKKDPSPHASDCLLTSLDRDGVTIFKYEYNSDKKISKVTDFKNNRIITYAYTNNKIDIQINTDGVITNENMEIGSNGLASKNSSMYYVYNNNKLIEAKYGNQKTYFRYENDNLIEAGMLTPLLKENVIILDTIVYSTREYYLDKPAQRFYFNTYPGIINDDDTFTGNSSKNLLKNINQKILHYYNIDYSYSFNDNGLIDVAHVAETFSVGIEKYDIKFNYTCK